MKERKYMTENKTYRLGDLIERSTENNRKLVYGSDLIEGVTNEGVFSVPKGNVSGVDLKPYKIVNNGDFVYNPSRLDLGSIAYRTQGLCIVSHLYQIFHLTNEGKKKIDPDWLFMYFRRSEFYREVSFRNFGSQRPEFNFNDMSEIYLPLPPLAAQQKAVAVYNALKANLAAYEQGLDDLKLVCDGFIEELRKKNTSERIDPYIKEINERNIGNKITLTQGVDVNLEFIPAKREAQDREETKIVRAGQFAFNKVVKSNGTKLPIALRVGKECVISSSYVVFEICNKEKLLPEFLMLWFSRSETHRRCGYIAQGTTRDVISFEDMCEVQIPLPPLEVQQNIVNMYKCYTERRRIAAELKEKIKAVCPILIKGSLEEM